MVGKGGEILPGGGYHPPRGVISPSFPPHEIGQGGGYPPPLILFLKNA